MSSRCLYFLAVRALSISLLTWNQQGESQNSPKATLHNRSEDSNSLSADTQQTRVPEGAILVKGAWSNASDAVTPLPEGGEVTKNIYSNRYFGITYALPSGWTEQYKGPPPSENGRYVLADIQPADSGQAAPRGDILIMAEDMFFTSFPATDTPELIHFMKDNLQADYKVEQPPAQTTIAGRSFTSFAYWSPVAQLHWYILATQIRCHTLELLFSSRNTNLLKNLRQKTNEMKLPPEIPSMDEEAAPVCVKDYASKENLLTRVDPVLTESRFNPVPVRIIIDKEGKIRHIHFLSAFPDQEKTISDALGQWKFRPYLKNGQPVEVETGILFGRNPNPAAVKAGSSNPE